MFMGDRKRGRTNRLGDLEQRNGASWSVQAMCYAKKRKNTFNRAGEVVCNMSGLGEDPIMYFRDNEAPTVSVYLTPVQFLTPAPALSNLNRSKVVESLADDKDQTI